MKIKNIRILNFKSIKDLTIPIQSYGEGVNKSNTAFLVGINESGKSAILEAISLINTGFEKIDYYKYCHKEHQEKDYNFIDIYVELDIENIEFIQKIITENLRLSEQFVKNIKIINLKKNIYKDENASSSRYEININADLPFFQYIINKEEKVVSGQTKPQVFETIELLSEFNKIEEKITIENAKTYLKENQNILTKEYFEKKIASILKTSLDLRMPNIQIWRPSSQYLINEKINLNEFKENTDISKPLKNIFLIYGKTTDEDIKSTIERVLLDQARCDELKEKMGEIASKYINNIWKEHKIKLKISINAENCEVYVEDKDKKYVYYSMEQRSDGFKQFISLILSLSAQNTGEILKDNLILIDEPEIHLHPSGIKYMRDEILKIGKKNYVFVATHSNYMIDTNVRERHWIVKKEEAETKITQMNEDYNFSDDKVLSTAFGLNIFKELLPPNIIIVEGDNDCEIISHAIRLCNKTFLYSIKGAGGANRMPTFAQILKEENIKPFILLDADNVGVDNKKKILEKQNDFYTEANVFTLKDLLPNLPKNSTIEDLIPIEFLKEFFQKEMSCGFNLDENDPVIYQLKRQNKLLQEDSQKLNSLKTKLVGNFCVKYKSKIEEKAPRLFNLVNTLLFKIDEFNKG